MRIKKIASIAVTSLLSLFVAFLLIVLIKNTVALKNKQISSFFGYSISYVPTESMNPTIRPGETVLIKKGSIEDARVGDIIVYNDGERYIIHRVTKILDNGCLKTKGDNNYTNPVEDSVEIDASMYYGKYIKTVNFLNFTSIIKNKNFIFPICILIYAVILISEGISIAKSIKRKNDENIKKMKDEHQRRMLKESLRDEVKRELLEEINKKNDTKNS